MFEVVPGMLVSRPPPAVTATNIVSLTHRQLQVFPTVSGQLVVVVVLEAVVKTVPVDC